MKHNILSYFIKDIKDQSEHIYYNARKNNKEKYISIFYKNELLYQKKYYGSYNRYNFITNIEKCGYMINNYKITYNKRDKYVLLYYKKDNKITSVNPNYIYYIFKHKKYLFKVSIEYVIENKLIFINRIQYYKCSKYLSKYAFKNKYTGVKIFIMNKYELHYINRFFNLLCL